MAEAETVSFVRASADKTVAAESAAAAEDDRSPCTVAAADPGPIPTTKPFRSVGGKKVEIFRKIIKLKKLKKKTF